MKGFKFALGAAVLLSTSAALVREELQDDHDDSTREKQDEGDDFAVGKIRMGIVEEGEVIGRAEYANGAPNSYFVRYRDGNACFCERWFDEDALTTRDDVGLAFAAELEAKAPPAAI